MAEEREQRQTTRMLGELNKLHPSLAKRIASSPHLGGSQDPWRPALCALPQVLGGSQGHGGGLRGGALKNALPPLHPHMSRKIRIAGYRLKGGKLVRDARRLSVSDRLRLAAASGCVSLALALVNGQSLLPMSWNAGEP